MEEAYQTGHYWLIRQVRRRIALLAELTLRSTMISYLIFYCS